MNKKQFPYLTHNGILMPFIPIILIRNAFTLDTKALIDSGSMVNVLPYKIGLALGGVWNDELAKLSLGGALSGRKACPFVLHAVIEGFRQIEIGCGWTNDDQSPVILGNVNFFNEFDICFHRKSKFFELTQY